MTLNHPSILPNQNDAAGQFSEQFWTKEKKMLEYN
jgi:hypothetical protein